MKAGSFVLPLLALIACAGWLVSRHHSAPAVRAENESLRQPSAARTSQPETRSSPRTRAAAAKAPIDWKKIAADQPAGIDVSTRWETQVQQLLDEMTTAELADALDEILALDPPPHSVDYLEQLVMNPLIRRNPRLALDRFIDRAQDSPDALSWLPGKAFAAWLEKNPPDAADWLDRQIAAGTFAANSPVRRQLEGVLMTHLLVTDADAAAARIAAAPPARRGDLLKSVSFQNFAEEKQQNFAAIVRSQLSEAESSAVIAQPAGIIANLGGYDKVTDYLRRVAATPAERAAAIATAGHARISATQRKLTRADFDEFHDWAATQSPAATADRATARLLANAAMNSRFTTFDEIAAIAAGTRETSGNEEILSVFLESPAARANQPAARLLAEKISDPTRRAEILQQLK
jgi:hypothetical protein